MWKREQPGRQKSLPNVKIFNTSVDKMQQIKESSCEQWSEKGSPENHLTFVSRYMLIPITDWVHVQQGTLVSLHSKLVLNPYSHPRRISSAPECGHGKLGNSTHKIHLLLPILSHPAHTHQRESSHVPVTADEGRFISSGSSLSNLY